jgi:hypothetical protein
MCDEERDPYSRGLVARNENLQAADIPPLEAQDCLQVIVRRDFRLTL